MDIPWVQLIWDSYYSPKIPHACDPVGSFWWKDILKLTPIFRGISKVNIVCGTTALFWKDLWSDQLLQDSHPRAFSHSMNKDISVKDSWGSQCWEKRFTYLCPPGHMKRSETCKLLQWKYNLPRRPRMCGITFGPKQFSSQRITTASFAGTFNLTKCSVESGNPSA